jgi:hypothetical protein
MTYLVREARHVGMALGLDSVRYYSIDIDIRNLSDFIILKSQGLTGLTSDLKWLYSIIEPPMIRNMPRQFFVILSRKGSVGIGEFKEIPWHKQERENILKAVGVKVEYGEPVEKGEYRGSHMTVGDKEHSEIIRLYIGERLSINKIAEQIGRSSRTPFKHIRQHNSKVEGRARRTITISYVIGVIGLLTDGFLTKAGLRQNCSELNPLFRILKSKVNENYLIFFSRVVGVTLLTSVLLLFNNEFMLLVFALSLMTCVIVNSISLAFIDHKIGNKNVE